MKIIFTLEESKDTARNMAVTLYDLYYDDDDDDDDAPCGHRLLSIDKIIQLTPTENNYSIRISSFPPPDMLELLPWNF